MFTTIRLCVWSKAEVYISKVKVTDEGQGQIFFCLFSVSTSLPNEGIFIILGIDIHHNKKCVVYKAEVCVSKINTTIEGQMLN